MIHGFLNSRLLHRLHHQKLTRLFQMLLQNFKHALVCPTIKKPSLDANILKNYRPISNLPFVSKVLEKIVSARLLTHLETNNLNEMYQSAYKKGHSTETALLRVQNDILCAIDNGQAVFLVLLDLSAAFNTIDHTILLDFLKSFLGVEGTAHDWFKSYVSNRTQSVTIDNLTSDPLDIAYGVPQGSVLGPVLFCIYTLPLGNIIRKFGLHLHIYADDTQVYCSFNVKDDSASSQLALLSNCVSEIRQWMSASKLKMNDDQTEFIIISSPAYVDMLSLYIGNIVVQSATNVKNLGVIFDNCINMKKHTMSVTKSAYFQL